MANIFALIQLILVAFQKWDAFLDWMNEKYAKEIEERRQSRDKAIGQIKDATSEDEFDKAQDDLVKSKPTP